MGFTPDRRRGLTKAVLDAYSRPLAGQLVVESHWLLLDQLVALLKHRCRPEYVTQLERAIAQRDVLGYLDCGKLSPQSYGDAASYFAEASLSSFLKKFPFGKASPVDTKATARKRWRRAERLCAIANRRISFYRDHPCRNPKWKRAWDLIPRIQAKIRRVIGSTPSAREVWDGLRFGPGGCIGVNGSETTAYYKYAAPAYTVTHRGMPYAVAAILNDRRWCEYLFDSYHQLEASNPLSEVHVAYDPNGSPISMDSDISEYFEHGHVPDWLLDRLQACQHNKVTFVPKDARTDRAIAIEPHLNIFLQLGAGWALRRKLRQAGMDLDHQATVNRDLANLGSTQRVRHHLRPVTLDLEMASDTICTEAVRELLPDGWFKFLSDLRSPFGVFEESPQGDRELVRYEKFSSMGNGYTFELESLIFWSIAQVACEVCLGFESESCYSFGDDIVVPSGAAALTVELLQYFGFRVNSEKSFFYGPFRESCGYDCFDGVLVRPFFLKRKLENAKDQIFLHNSLMAQDVLWANAGVGADSGEIRAAILRTLPGAVKRHLHGPVSPDLEGHIWSAWDIGVHSAFVRWDPLVQRWSFASVKAVPRVYRGRLWPRYLQFRESVRNSAVRLSDAHPSKVLSGEELLKLIALRMIRSDWQLTWGEILLMAKESGGSSGDVTRRESVEQRVTVSYTDRADWS